MVQNYGGFIVNLFVGTEDCRVKEKVGGGPNLRTFGILRATSRRPTLNLGVA